MTQTMPTFSVPAKPRPDGSFVASVKLADGMGWRDVRVPKALVKSRREAEKWVADHVEALARGASPRELVKMPAGGGGRVTFEDVNQAVLDARADDITKKGRADATGYEFRNHWKNHIEPFFSTVAPHEVEPKHLNAFIDHLVAEKLAPRTVRNVVKNLGIAFKVILGRGLDPRLTRHPVRAAIEAGLLSLPSVDDGPTAFIPRADAAKLLRCEGVPEHRRVRYALALLSGLRDGEVAGLTWADVDLEKGTLSVTKALPIVRARGGKLALAKTKTKSSARALPLHAIAAEFLDGWKREGWGRFVAESLGRSTPLPTDPVFPNDRGELYRPDSAAGIRTDLSTAGLPTQRGGVPLDFHATRASFATWLDEAGVHGEVADRLLGHAGTSVRARHYIGADLAPLRAAVDRLTLPGFGAEPPPSDVPSDGAGRTSETTSEAPRRGSKAARAPERASSETPGKAGPVDPTSDGARPGASPQLAFVNRRSRVQISKVAPSIPR